MMLKELTYSKEKAIIINCGTHLSTTLAILSVLRYCKTDLVVLNCQMPTDLQGAENAFLRRLQDYSERKQLGTFSLLEMPLRLHGDTLDEVFRTIPAEQVLLVDSDLEVLEPTLIGEMRRWMRDENCFGAGFFHGPYFGFGGGRFPMGFYAERMWIPFTLLRVNAIKKALAAGNSFNICRIYNDFPYNERIGRLLYKFTTRFKLTSWKNPFRKPYLGFRPNLVLQDTGANIYAYLQRQGMFYGGGRTHIFPWYVAHYDGITRSSIAKANGTVDASATQYTDVQMKIIQRLKTEYQLPDYLLI